MLLDEWCQSAKKLQRQSAENTAHEKEFRGGMAIKLSNILTYKFQEVVIYIH